jgi:hypothetical protein
VPAVALTLSLLAMGCVREPSDSSNQTVASELASGAVTATLVLNDWGAGYTADVRLSNTGAATTAWTVVVALGGSTLTNSWNATVTNSAGTLTAQSLGYNGAIPANPTAVWGFQGAGAAPARPTLLSLSVTPPNGGGGSSTGVDGATGTGGRSGSGGAIGAGGSGVGGVSGTGGVRGTGGLSGTGGRSPGTGGATGAGGSGTAVTPIQTGCTGYATRFWDCCKPHCGWSANVPAGVSPVTTCSISNAPVSRDVQSSCDGGGAYQCFGLAPWAVSPTLAYGFAATSSGDICGRCYQLQFTGASFNAGNDPGSPALAGKTMIVQAINVGGDVANHQFDLLVPGGGVGQFNACSTQWGVAASDLGAQFGGFLSTCKQQLGGNGAGLAALKSCVSQKCTSVFGGRSADLAAGCAWFVDWFQVADNPALKFKEVRCPVEITNKSSMSRSDVANTCPN